MNTDHIKAGNTVNHSNFGLVRIVAVETRGVLVLQTFGREGFRTTREIRVAKRDLSAA